MGSKEKIDTHRLPVHIAIIMDGNGRWARERSQDRLYGHQEGVESVREIAEGCSELGIEYLSLYAFSTENWERPAVEVNGIMELLVFTIRKEINTLCKNNIRLLVIGNVMMLPLSCRTELDEAMDYTRNCTGLKLVLALSYGSREEIAHAARLIAEEVRKGKTDPEEIDSLFFSRHLYTGQIPDPELMIRTSGEYRISNFLLFQLAYAELYFTKTCWPDFRKENLYEAIVNYQSRERRFGKTSEQIQQDEEMVS
ncbi:MAG TPA: isoprenyl transferase [Chitinophagaceae bacterium]|nr:isoprenyl transferase [Chitinophagaceae bacterium]